MVNDCNCKEHKKPCECCNNKKSECDNNNVGILLVLFILLIIIIGSGFGTGTACYSAGCCESAYRTGYMC